VVDWPDPAVELSDEVVIRIEVNGLCGSDLRALATSPGMVHDVGVILRHEFSASSPRPAARRTCRLIGCLKACRWSERPSRSPQPAC
jgi:hypothetical protein